MTYPSDMIVTNSEVSRIINHLMISENERKENEY